MMLKSFTMDYDCAIITQSVLAQSKSNAWPCMQVECMKNFKMSTVIVQTGLKNLKQLFVVFDKLHCMGSWVLIL